MAEPATTVARWRAVAGRYADAIAVRSPDGSLTYGAARDRADERGRALAAAVDEPGRPIAVDVESDVDSVLAVLSVLCSGHPVILLDPLLPAERREHILAFSGARRFDPASMAALPPSDAPVPEPDPIDPSILIFTSGSTGKPKGLIHSQRGWVNQATDGREFLGLGPGDRMAVLLPISFGAGVDCLVMGLLNGATLLLWDVRRRTTTGLRDWLCAEAATTAHCTPSLLRSWLGDLDTDAALPELRLLSTCGEPVRGADVTRVRRTVMPSGTFCSWSGSSEIGNLAFNLFGPDRAVPDGAVAVGIPAGDKHVRIVDDNGDDVDAGDVGEIVVESGHLASGYHNDPELTAQRFEPIGDGRSRLRTGDLGRFDDSGMLHLLGRRDDAIKVRGYLVEPAEVETALRAMPWTVDAVVSANTERTQLIAHVAVDPSKWTPSPAEVRTALATTLAPWMIPRDVVIMTELPRNERGKVDRVALPEPAARPKPDPPRGPTESMLALLWQEILGLDQVGRQEDFITLGGDSLAAATMIADINHRFQVELDTGLLTQAPTVAEFAQHLDAANESREKTATPRTLVRLREGVGSPLFLVAGAGSLATSLTPLARALATPRPVYGVQARGIEGRGRADQSIRAAARRLIRDVRSVQPRGPYLLGGYSWGGFVAIEAAARLSASGEHCESVIVLDSIIDPILAAAISDPKRRRRWRVAVDPAPATVTGALPDRSGKPSVGVETRSRWQIAWNVVVMNVLMSAAGLVRLPTTLQWTVFFDLGTRMIRRHRPVPFPGDIMLIRSRSNTDDLSLWRHFSLAAVRPVDVSGDHHSMVRTPYVSETAKAVGTAIGERVQEGAR
ncbi:alpha/beta fold hydrolase [Gordonia tangerina]|uniref:Alpha/beta fold hydrolase n=1 Tax=Gordonia tangerina TaxID=2911060 RepID=A0ABS9DKF6_9ACTN|nr:alpha/beta fold hydrolase [Gordonia tangerina]MCF3939717.1 alpha/beta fold hydrolase [Gordonia tangerina]